MAYRLLATTAVLMALASPARADNEWGTTEGFLKDYVAGDAVARVYIHGVADGLNMYNAREALEGGHNQFFCPPDDTALASDQLVDIMQRFLDKSPKMKSQRVYGVLFFALRDAFPCK